MVHVYFFPPALAFAGLGEKPFTSIATPASKAGHPVVSSLEKQAKGHEFRHLTPSTKLKGVPMSGSELIITF